MLQVGKRERPILLLPRTCIKVVLILVLTSIKVKPPNPFRFSSEENAESPLGFYKQKKTYYIESPMGKALLELGSKHIVTLLWGDASKNRWVTGA